MTSTLVFEGDGAVNEYVGGYSDWLRQRKTPAGVPGPAKREVRAPQSAPAPQAVSKPRRMSYKDQRELDSLPGTIQLLETEQGRLQIEVGDPDLFRQAPDKAAGALRRLQELEAELERAYARWGELESSRTA